MATYNNKTKTPDSDDEDSYDGSSGKGIIQPDSHSVIENFNNDIDFFKPIGPLRKELSSKLILDNISTTLLLVKRKRLLPRINLCTGSSNSHLRVPTLNI